MGWTIEGKLIVKDEELFLSLYITSLYVPHSQLLFPFNYGELAIASIEVVITCCCIIVAFRLRAKTTPLVIECTMNPAVQLSTTWDPVNTTGTVVIYTIIAVIVIAVIVKTSLQLRQYNLHLLHLL